MITTGSTAKNQPIRIRISCATFVPACPDPKNQSTVTSFSSTSWTTYAGLVVMTAPFREPSPMPCRLSERSGDFHVPPSRRVQTLRIVGMNSTTTVQVLTIQ